MDHFYPFRISKLLNSISRGAISRKDYFLYIIYYIFLWGIYLLGPSFFSQNFRYNNMQVYSSVASTLVMLGSIFYIDKKNRKYNINTVLNYISIYAVEFWKFFLIKFFVAITIGYLYVMLSIPRDPMLENSFFWTLDQELVYVFISELFIQYIMISRFSNLWILIEKEVKDR